MKISEVVNQIEKDFPIVSMQDFDNSGSNIVNLDDELIGILLTLDITLDAITYAKDNGINLIISHHPIIFNKIRNINEDPVSKRIKLLNKYDINAYSCHTNYDANLKNGMGTSLVNLLFDSSLIKEQGILEKFKVNNEEYGIGNIIYFNKEFSADELKNLFIEKLKLDNNKISFYKCEDSVKKVIIIPGSGSGDVDLVIKEKADMLITSDLKHNQIIDLKESNISYFDATHYGLENIFISSFYEYLKSLSILSDIKTICFDINL